MLLSITYLYAFVNHSKKEWINMVIIMLSRRKSRKSKRPIIFCSHCRDPSLRSEMMIFLRCIVTFPKLRAGISERTPRRSILICSFPSVFNRRRQEIRGGTPIKTGLTGGFDIPYKRELPAPSTGIAIYDSALLPCSPVKQLSLITLQTFNRWLSYYFFLNSPTGKTGKSIEKKRHQKPRRARSGRAA